MKQVKILAMIPVFGVVASLQGAVVYTGGIVSSGNVPGMADLVDPAHSTDVRAKGGRLYCHELAWTRSPANVQAAVPTVFTAAPTWESVMPSSHALWSLSTYCKPSWSSGAWCLTVNGAADATTDFTALINGKTGLANRVAPIMSPNGGEWSATPWSSTRWNQYRANCQAGRALSTDSPPYFYNAQPAGYKQFTAAQLTWANNNNVTSMLYMHPGSSVNYLQDTISEIGDLAKQGAVPAVYILNSYYGGLDTNSLAHPIGWEQGGANEILRVADYVINTY